MILTSVLCALLFPGTLHSVEVLKHAAHIWRTLPADEQLQTPWPFGIADKQVTAVLCILVNFCEGFPSFCCSTASPATVQNRILPSSCPVRTSEFHSIMHLTGLGMHTERHSNGSFVPTIEGTQLIDATASVHAAMDECVKQNTLKAAV